MWRMQRALRLEMEIFHGASAHRGWASGTEPCVREMLPKASETLIATPGLPDKQIKGLHKRPGVRSRRILHYLSGTVYFVSDIQNTIDFAAVHYYHDGSFTNLGV